MQSLARRVLEHVMRIDIDDPLDLFTGGKVFLDFLEDRLEEWKALCCEKQVHAELATQLFDGAGGGAEGAKPSLWC